ncbi:MAG: response regulator transcription factor [Caldisericia bacterium]|nr:response regulator transcription factor [Caldisericia bacterium]
MKKTIYLADDEKSIREVLVAFLQSEGYIVTAFADGLALWERFQVQPCDLAILDIMMPRMDGFETCKLIRDISTIPIVMLSARNSDLDYATGINIGSDDYFTKPFSATSLTMRVKAIFRRIEMDISTLPDNNTSLQLGDILLIRNQKTLMIQQQKISLTPNEYNLLEYLLLNKHRAVSRDEVLQTIWGYNYDVETRAADDTVRRLRKKMQHSNVAIETIWGFGFRILMSTNEKY